MAWYNVDLGCPRCGKNHGVIGGIAGGLVIDNGADRPGTIAERYEGQELPRVLVELLNDNVWCDQVGDYTPPGNPLRVTLTPQSST